MSCLGALWPGAGVPELTIRWVTVHLGLRAGQVLPDCVVLHSHVILTRIGDEGVDGDSVTVPGEVIVGTVRVWLVCRIITES